MIQRRVRHLKAHPAMEVAGKLHYCSGYSILRMAQHVAHHLPNPRIYMQFFQFEYFRLFSFILLLTVLLYSLTLF